MMLACIKPDSAHIFLACHAPDLHAPYFFLRSGCFNTHRNLRVRVISCVYRLQMWRLRKSGGHAADLDRRAFVAMKFYAFPGNVQCIEDAWMDLEDKLKDVSSLCWPAAVL